MYGPTYLLIVSLIWGPVSFGPPRNLVLSPQSALLVAVAVPLPVACCAVQLGCVRCYEMWREVISRMRGSPGPTPQPVDLSGMEVCLLLAEIQYRHAAQPAMGSYDLRHHV